MPSRDTIGLTLSSIQACCTSLLAPENIGDITDADLAQLERIYKSIQAIQQRAAGMTPELSRDPWATDERVERVAVKLVAETEVTIEVGRAEGEDLPYTTLTAEELRKAEIIANGTLTDWIATQETRVVPKARCWEDRSNERGEEP